MLTSLRLPGSAIAVAAFAVAVSALSVPARANQATATSCAKSLAPEASAIYEAVAPEVTPSTDLRSALKTKVTAMAVEGEVQPATARASAIAAYGCLKRLK
ncbi:MAG: hypothetical protein HIU92_06530 [Proteobacteria bacterium]|nr:hypothetical protein [Pseudomonadota bacterium]